MPAPEKDKKDENPIKIVNVVVSSSLEQELSLEKIAANLANTEYNPEQFPGLVLRLKEPKASLLLFSSGKAVCTGTKNMEEASLAFDKVISQLGDIDIKIKIKPKISIQNLVASGNIGMAVNLNSLAMKLNNTEYEPEQFPGLVYKMTFDSIKTTFLLFSNGKIVCTGTKSEEQVHRAVEKLIENLKKVMK